jgi:sulfur transfer complex TusBCD TusB component (DsrH family)
MKVSKKPATIIIKVSQNDALLISDAVYRAAGNRRYSKSTNERLLRLSELLDTQFDIACLT